MISIKEISHINKPIVWTMHDMWPFCGGEHFTNNLRNQNNYSSFNRPVNESGLDINKFVWNKKNNRKMIIKNFSYKNRINYYLKFYKKILEK